MSFFDTCDNNQAGLALRRTKQNIEDGFRYASKHPVEAALVVGSLVALMVIAPAPILLALLVGALTLICLNLFTPASFVDNLRSYLP